MERNLPGKEGNPHLLDFTDVQQSVCQQNFNKNSTEASFDTHTQIKQRLKSALISKPNSALSIFINIFILIKKNQPKKKTPILEENGEQKNSSKLYESVFSQMLLT